MLAHIVCLQLLSAVLLPLDASGVGVEQATAVGHAAGGVYVSGAFNSVHVLEAAQQGAGSDPHSLAFEMFSMAIVGHAGGGAA